ncbi:uncharacterized protein Z519_00125 [Cladophialophora bantiana CBS 173.52]|uniref:Amino acid permease/ SLC12A domain-containing protein n=1 Tax=Cladophialophora bantiana (strain ATCC 10958 / CBS 173.52 / CDC B-1940 / NIH 8579) TaxID=1442370 RepID=A0A0D2INZ0_CLAB1|nr:uncharacterized protein Z519_00125 [Cladophialophora bantiana CBS 173.52]KIW98464.1 hypothetical protein Z519_00125 [Cladophialophora bantiana CBS 173.52]
MDDNDVEMSHKDNKVIKSVDQQEYNSKRAAFYPYRTRGAQVLDRYISFIPTIAFPATLQSSWEAVAVSFQAGLLNGGPTALVWGTLLCIIGSLAVALSLGWITVFAWIAVCAQVCFLEGTILQGLIILNDDTYVPKLWHGTLLAWAILAFPLICNIFARRVLAQLEVLGGILHIVLFIVFVAVLASLSPRSSADFVFTDTVTNLSGYPSSGVSWCIGLLSGAFPLAGFDGVLHMSAEVKNAPLRVPQSMVLSVLINGILAFGIIITILFTIGDPVAVSQTAYVYPIIQMLYNSTGSKGATTAMMSLLLFIGVVAVFSTLASVSRLTWAFARDNGLPFSNFFGRVNATLRIPLNSLSLITIIVMLLQLINIGSTTAFFAILSLNTLALYLSYIIPILFLVIHKLQGFGISYGPFRLPRGTGLPINIFAVCYAVFIVIWLPFPSTVPVTAETMNYGGPVMGAVILFALVDWFLGGKRRFQVPMDIRHDEHTLDEGE